MVVMRKIVNLLVTIILVFGLTGCVKYHVDMEISNDKSVTLEIIHGVNISAMGDLGGVDDEFIEDGDSSLNEDDTILEEGDDSLEYDPIEGEFDTGIDYEKYELLKEKGFIVEDYLEQTEDGTIQGVKLTKNYPNIDDISTDKEIIVKFNERFDTENLDNFDDSTYFTKKGNNYLARFTFDFSSEEGMDMSMYDDMLDLQYKIKLPKKSISNNATSVSEDGKELIWELKYGKDNQVNFEFSLANDSNLIILALSILFFVSSCCVLGFAIYKANKPHKSLKPINE